MARRMKRRDRIMKREQHEWMQPRLFKKKSVTNQKAVRRAKRKLDEVIDTALEKLETDLPKPARLIEAALTAIDNEAASMKPDPKYAHDPRLQAAVAAYQNADVYAAIWKLNPRELRYHIRFEYRGAKFPR